MAKAIRIHEPGGSHVMRFEDVHVAPPRAGEVLLRQTAIGLNYIDVYHRSGLYPLAEYPATLGLEACGYVEQVGEGVSDFRPGDRVAYGGGPIGAYAEYRTLPAKFLVKIPDSVSNEQAAGLMVQGLTAHLLLRRCFVVREGTTCLIHAAAGGVGTLLCQWAKHLGAVVIGTVGSEEKVEIARANGCAHVILYRSDNVAERVRALTGGEGVSVVYDSVGRDTFLSSLDCLRTFGLMVSYGQASGPIPPFDVSLLMQKGSLYLTRPSMMHYMQDTGEYRRSADELFSLVAQGVLKVHIGQRFPLADAARAHDALEARQTRGATVLLANEGLSADGG